MASPDQLREVREGDVPSASQWNIMVALLKRRVTGPNIYEDSTGWHFRPSVSGGAEAAAAPVFYSRKFHILNTMPTAGTWYEAQIEMSVPLIAHLSAGKGIRVEEDCHITGISVEWLEHPTGHSGGNMTFQPYNTTDNDATDAPEVGPLASDTTARGSDATGLQLDDNQELTLRYKTAASSQAEGWAWVTFAGVAG